MSEHSQPVIESVLVLLERAANASPNGFYVSLEIQSILSDALTELLLRRAEEKNMDDLIAFWRGRADAMRG